MNGRLFALALAVALAACHQAPPAGDNRSGVAAGGSDETADRLEGPLARYVGHRADEAIGGRSFLADPLVRDGVTRTVADPAVAALVLGSAARTPIAARDGQLIAAGCAPADCTGRNWAILIGPDGDAPQVCVAAQGAAPRWYGDTPVGAAKDSCPQGG